MTSNRETDQTVSPRQGIRAWWWKVLAVAVVAVVGATLLRGSAEGRQTGATALAVRGRLPVTVLVQGTIEATQSQDIKSEVKGRTTIMNIVEEGYLVTQEDVDNGKILVELNDSELQTKLTQQEISVQNAYAQYTNAREEYEIQVKQNESDIMAAGLDSKFKRMDFERYLGKELAETLIEDLGLQALEDEAHIDIAVLYTEIREQARELGAAVPADDEEWQKAEHDVAEAPEGARRRERPDGAGREGQGRPASGQPNRPSNAAAPANNNRGAIVPVQSMIEMSLQSGAVARPDVDFSVYATPGRLTDGEAEQRLRRLEDDLLMARNELTQAQTQLDGTQRLAERGFVTQSELDRDETELERSRIRVQSAETARQIFIRYEFPKEAEKLLSDYEESLRRLVRTKKQAISKLSQAETRLLTQRVQLDLQVTQRDDLLEQIANCRIPAKRVGMVVYGGRDRNPWRNQTVIEVGTEVHEGFDILTIPDMSEMAARASIHESDITKIQREQQARIRLEAFPDRELTGRVLRVAPLPDSGGRWSPDEKLYPVRILIDGMHEWLMPGMTSEVEIIVAELDDVVYVPLQAVSGEGSRRVIHVLDRNGRPQRRNVTTGQFNDVFVEIAEGVEAGEEVLLLAPSGDGDEREESGGPELIPMEGVPA